MPRNYLKSILLIVLVYLFVTSCKKDVNSDNNASSTTTNISGDINVVLGKGINLSNWFNDYSDPAQFSNRFTSAHFKKLKQLGFTYVRIPVGSTILFQQNSPSILNISNLVFIESAIKNANNEGLAVTLNFQPYTEDFEKSMISSPSQVLLFCSYWKSLVTYFKNANPSQLFFEIFNEPHPAAYNVAGIDGKWWYNVQKQIIDSIRTVDTIHYVIAGGEDWNSISGLREMKAYTQPNIIYDFHFYDPYMFTHQGASWAAWPYNTLQNVPYPSSPQNVAPIITNYSDAYVQNLLNWYGNSNFNADSLSNHIQLAANWATANNVKVICNEFGCYKPYTPADCRIKLIGDVRTALEKFNIGWAMWDCDEGFGFITYPNTNDRNTFITDDNVLKALGLL